MIADIVSLVDTLEEKVGELDDLPYSDLVSFMTEYKLKRRRGRG